MLSKPEALQTHSLGIFAKASSLRQKWLNHHPLVMSSIFGGLFPSPKGYWKFQLSNYKVSSSGNQPTFSDGLEVFQKSSHYHKVRWLKEAFYVYKRHETLLSPSCLWSYFRTMSNRPNIIKKRPSCFSYHLGNYKEFRNCTPGTRMRTKYILLIINHNIILDHVYINHLTIILYKLRKREGRVMV